MTPEVPLRALVVLDDSLIVETVTLTLNHGACSVHNATTVSAAVAAIPKWRPHFAVVDMDLGVQVLLQALGLPRHDDTPAIPVLALTRRGDLKGKLAAFDMGADDVMAIPFSPEEFLARILVITRRSFGVSPPFIPVLQIGDLAIDILNRRVTVGTSELHLTGLEQSLLYLLVANSERVVTRDEILDAVWGTDFIAESNIVDRHVRALRAKLQNDWRRPRFIATVPGRGYRFLPAVESTSPSDGAE